MNSGINSLASHMDMAATHIAEKEPLTYEGKLNSLETFGPMTALQFSDGKMFDVVDAPEGLMHGDVVRIYNTDKGLVAHLWQRGTVQDQVSLNPPLTPRPQ